MNLIMLTEASSIFNISDNFIVVTLHIEFKHVNHFWPFLLILSLIKSLIEGLEKSNFSPKSSEFGLY